MIFVLGTINSNEKVRCIMNHDVYYIIKVKIGNN